MPNAVAARDGLRVGHSRLDATGVTPTVIAGRTGRLPRFLRSSAHVVGAAAYAGVALATAWGGAPGTAAAAVSAPAPTGSLQSLVVAVVELVGAVALLDSDLAPLASMALSVGMLVALAAAVIANIGPTGAAVLLAAALPVAWVTRDERRATYRALRAR